jgi:hypothetical protein
MVAVKPDKEIKTNGKANPYACPQQGLFERDFMLIFPNDQKVYQKDA